ncbi:MULTISPECIES: anti-sigma factor [unclassified Ruegeria]|uniref:anti-sigma factor family protein n=1 Tax=unclassified Ruegeria TaxID=2625375 RepID=UPI001492F9CD|nr:MULTISPECIES: anti-sigma factor [unclassified Ruegeria]NOC45548.1 hypothetical protein [Ruegeria sp. HKCCD7559]
MTTEPNMDTLIQAAVDGQLTPSQQDRLDRHLAAHPADRARLAAMIRQAGIMRISVPQPDPAQLDRLMHRAREGTSHGVLGRLAAAVAIFALGLGSGLLLSRDSVKPEKLMAQAPIQAAAAHALYSPEVLHPVEVFADEREHLQTWLSNRLGAPVIAPELGETGYRLIGGRLLPLGQGPAAFFLYENESGDRLSLFANLTTDPARTSFQYRRDGDLGIVFWQDGRWEYSMVGRSGRQVIETIARKAHEELI